jgi:signal transduction histidine kinase
MGFFQLRSILEQDDGSVRLWDITIHDVLDNAPSSSWDFKFRLEEMHPRLYIKRIWDATENYFVFEQEEQDFPILIDWVRKFKKEDADEIDRAIKVHNIKSTWFAAIQLAYGRMNIELLVPPSAEIKSILSKIGAAFDLAYKRFLDLQKAEAQAREARIEAALERVRSRTMGMKSSGELTEVAELLFQQVSALGIQTWTSGFNVWSDDNNLWTDYLTNPQGGFIEPYTIDTAQYPVWTRISDAKKRGDEFYVNYEEGEQLQETYRQLSRFGEKQFKAILNSGFSFPTKQYEHLVFGSKVSLMFITYEPVTEAHDIFKRFGKVFEQTYTRFLDLQKAEAQAKEAKIEAALERVRSRTMAMQKSAELAEVIQVIFDQLCGLHFRMDSASFVVETNETNDLRNWLAATGRKYASRIDVPYIDHPIFNRFIEAKEKGETFYTLQLAKEDKDRFFDYYLQFAPIPDERKTIIYNSPGWAQSAVVMKIIGLNITNYAGVPYSEEENNTLVRFGNAFEQTYIRFLDLQRAEANAVRAEQDLVEIKAARKRAEDALAALKATQQQLIQKEKMASLGELTAGIAHEIQNPLNFVNNFSETNTELLAELKQEAKEGNTTDVIALAEDLEQNQHKITHHGRRADSIVKGMLQHARASRGEKQPTDLNQLVEEHLRLAYHSYRIKDQSFNADITTEYDPHVEHLNVIPQEIGRVLLNLFSNAFYAVSEKKQQLNGTFEPFVSVSTQKRGDHVLITVRDNGSGMSPKVAEKVFQPFFTTKPTGEGTGLGLSLSYDIVTKGHGGNLSVSSKEGEGAEFLVQLPVAKIDYR